MKLYCLLAMCAACSSVPADNKPDVSPGDASIPEASEEVVSDDAGEEAETSTGYVACITRWTVPTSYPRLASIYCTDSTGYTYLDGFWDDQLNLECYWKLASDFHTRCLPQNEQSEPLYDQSCANPISLAAVNKDGGLVEPFIGIDQVGDAGTTVIDYQIGMLYPDNQFSFRAVDFDSGAWQCYGTIHTWPPGFRLFYLGPKQDPTIFVEQ